MRKNIFIFILLVTPLLQAKASDSFAFADTSFEIKTDRALEKIQEVALNPQNFLMNYRPEGARISNKVVSNSEIQFYATNTILFFTQTVFIRGFVAVEEKSNLCLGSSKGYFATMNFSGSDAVIIDNFEKMELLICVTEKSSTLLNAIVKGRIIKGNNYNGLTGKFVKDMINQQVRPLIAAIKIAVEEKNNAN